MHLHYRIHCFPSGWERLGGARRATLQSAREQFLDMVWDHVGGCQY